MNSVLESLQMAFPEVAVSIIKKPKHIGGTEMTEQVQELHMELDSVHGDLLIAIEGIEALKHQINATNAKMQYIFSQPLDMASQQRMLAHSREFKLEMRSIENQMNYLMPILLEAKADLGELNKLAGEIAHKKSPQTECDQSKAEQ